MRSRAPVLLIWLLFASFVGLTQPAYAQKITTLDHGHADIFYVKTAGDGVLNLGVKEDVTGQHVERTAEETLLVVKESALTAIPDGYPGAPQAYLLPLTQKPELLWPGWDTQPVREAGLTEVQIHIREVKGPGVVHVFSQDWNGVKSLLADGGYTLPGTITVPQPAHVHANWAFTKPGVYTFTVQATAMKNGRQWNSNVATYTWQVGNVPAPAPTPTTDPVPTTDPTPTTDPVPTTDPTPTTDPVPTTDPTPTTDPVPTTTPTPTTAPTPTTPPKPKPVPKPKPKPKPVPKPGRIILDHGHTDVFNVFNNRGKPDLNLLEDITGQHVMRSPEDVVLVVRPQARQQVPKIGMPIDGQTAYVLPITQQPNLLWPGWNTLGLQGSKFSSAAITITSVKGPGTIYLSTTAGFDGKQKPVLADGSFDLPGTIKVPEPAHVHANWFFTKPGTYTVKVRATVSAQHRLRDALPSGTVATPERTYTFVVGERPGKGKQPAPSKITTPNGGTTPPITQPIGPTTGHSPTPSVTPTKELCLPTKVKVNETVSASGGPRANAVEGHFDFGGVIDKGRLVPSMKDDRKQPAVWVAPESLNFIVGDKAKKKAPAGMEFIAPAGSDIWLIGATQEPGVPWLGQNSMHETIVNETTGPIQWKLDKVDGPGKVAVFHSGTFGSGVGARVFDNVGGPTSFTLAANTHAHPNWVFTKPGNYQLTITETVTMKNGKHLSGTATLFFSVGGTTPAGSSASTGTGQRMVEKVVGRTPDGRPCELPPGASPKTGVDNSLQGAGAAGDGMPASAIPVLATVVLALYVLRRRRAMTR